MEGEKDPGGMGYKEETDNRAREMGRNQGVWREVVVDRYDQNTLYKYWKISLNK